MKVTQQLLFYFLFAISTKTFAQAPIPEYGGKRVYDLAGVLSPTTVAQLERTLMNERDSSTNQKIGRAHV